MTKGIKIIISGGGTGGHVFPAIAIADALKVINNDIQILFVGAKGKLEMEKVPQAGYEIRGLNIAGMQRSLSLKNLSLPFKIIASLWKSQRIINSFYPSIAVGVGGYASGPLLQMAFWKGVPIVIQEQNSFPGITNKLLASKAKKICVSYENMDRFFPKDRIIMTGNPVRNNIQKVSDISKKEACKYFDLDEANMVVFVTGGSLGAGTINESISAGIDKFVESGVQLIWQTGKLYFDKYNKLNDKKGIVVLPFLDKMELAYAASELIIARAGALTISELSIIGKAVILVPSPNVSEDHQTHNAQSMVNSEAAVMVADEQANDILVNKAINLINDQAKRKSLGINIKALAKPDAAMQIAKEILDCVS